MKQTTTFLTRWWSAFFVLLLTTLCTGNVWADSGDLFYSSFNEDGWSTSSSTAVAAASVPDGWYQAILSGTDGKGWYKSTGTNPVAQQDGAYLAGYWFTGSTMLSTPAFNVSEAGVYQLSIDAYRFNSSWAHDQIEIFVCEEQEPDESVLASENSLLTISNSYSVAQPQAESAAGWYTYEVPVTLTAGTKYLVIKYTQNDGWYFAIDNLRLFVAPTCLAPTSISIASTTQTSVMIDAIEDPAGVGEYDYAIKPVGEEPDEADFAYLDDVTIGGLEPSSTYKLYVRTHCSDEDRSSAISVSFHTACGVMPVENFNFDFETTDGWTTSSYTSVSDATDFSNLVPTCWDEYIVSTASSRYAWSLSTTQSHSSSHSLMFNSSSSSSGFVLDLVSPTVNIPAANAYRVSFWMYRSANYPTYDNEYIEVFAASSLPVSESADDALIAVRRATALEPAVEETGWYKYVADIPVAGDINIVLRGHSQYGIFIYLDDLLIEEIPACSEITGLAIDDVAARSVTISFEEGDKDGFEYAVKPAGEAVAEEDFAELEDYTISGLQPETNYVLYLRGVCGEDRSPIASKAFTTTVSCKAPTTLNVTDISTTSAMLEIVDPDGIGEYLYAVKPASETIAEEDFAVLEDLVIAGLDPATSYVVAVKTNCGEYEGTPDISAATSTTFATACDVISLDNFNFDFSDATGWATTSTGVTTEAAFTAAMAPCWDGKIVSGSTVKTWARSTTSGKTCLMQSYSSAETYTLLIAPQVNIPAADTYRLKASVYRSGTNWHDDYLAFYVSTTPDLSGAQQLFEVHRRIDGVSATAPAVDEAGWYDYTGNISLAGDLYIIIESLNNDGMTQYFTDLKIEEVPSCDVPASVAFSEITTNSVKVTIADENPAHTQWELHIVNAVENSDEIFAEAGGNIQVIEGLLPSTAYDVFVRTYCSETEQSPWLEAGSFATRCDAFTILDGDPFEENFNLVASGAIPACWSRTSAKAFASSSTLYIAPKDDSNYLRLEAISTAPVVVTLPAFTNDLSTLEMSFDFVQESLTSSGPIEVGYVTDGDPATFELIEAKVADVATVWQSAEILMPLSLAGINGQLAFRYASSNTTSWVAGIDNIVISIKPSCIAPDAVAVAENGLKATSVTLDITDSHNVGASYEYVIKLAGEELTSTDEFVALDDTRTVTGLNPETEYNLYLRANCGEGDGNSEVVSLSFTTLAACAAPTLAVESVTAHSVTLDIYDPNAGLSFEYVLKPESETIDPETDEFIAMSVDQTIEYLEANTTYHVGVRVLCSLTEHSDVAVLTFTTPCEALTTLPWSVGFESEDGFQSGNLTAATLPSCWAYPEAATKPFAISSSYKHEGSYALQLPDQSAGNVNVLVSPAIEIPAADAYRLRYWLYRNSSTYGTDAARAAEGFYIYYNTMPELPADESQLLNFVPSNMNFEPVEEAAGWYEYSATIPASGTMFFVIKGLSQYVTASYMDNLIIEAIPSCDIPTTMSFLNIMATTATALITDGNVDHTQWQLMLTDENDNITTFEPSGSQQELTGLIPEMTYQVAVRTYCSETDQSEWLEGFEFTTEPSCTAPQSVSVTPSTHSAAVTIIDDVMEHSAWEIRLNGGELVDAIYEAGDKDVTLDGLMPATTYSMEIRTVCSETDQSAWEDAGSFTTACEAVILPYTEDFEGMTAVSSYSGSINAKPDCWSIIGQATIGNYPSVSVSSYSSYVIDGNNSLLFVLSNTVDQLVAVLPNISDDVNNAVLKFKYSYESATRGTMSVGYVLGDVFTEFADFTHEKSTTATDALYLLQGVPEGARIAIAYSGISSSWYTLRIDDISIIRPEVTYSEYTLCQGEDLVIGGEVKAAAADLNLGMNVVDLGTVVGEWNEPVQAVGALVTVNAPTVEEKAPIRVSPSMLPYDVIYEGVTVYTVPETAVPGDFLEPVVTVNCVEYHLTINVVENGQPTGLNDLDANSIAIAPNPISAGQVVTVRHNFSESMLSGMTADVYDMNGKLVTRQAVSGADITIDAFHTSGLYMVRLRAANGETFNATVLVK